jgi:cephalosporin hydroxylase
MDWYEVADTAVGVHHASQHRDELAAALTVVADLGPSVIVEIGCDAGGTLYAWRQVCDRVYGITAADNSYEAGGSSRPLDAHGSVVLIGDSHDPSSVAWLDAQLAGDPVDALIIDGDHTYAGVSDDLGRYGPLVRPGGLILLHDIVTVDPRAEVRLLWPELVDRYRTTQIRGPFGWGVIHWDGAA